MILNICNACKKPINPLEEKLVGKLHFHKHCNKTKSYLLRGVIKYNHTPKGKATRKRYIDAHKKEIIKYNVEYQRQARKRCKALGICNVCKQEPARVTLTKDIPVIRTTCEKCWKVMRLRKRVST